jgi:hypothetical protein
MGGIATGPVDAVGGDGVPAGAFVAAMENGNSGDGVKSLRRTYRAETVTFGRNAYDTSSTRA